MGKDVLHADVDETSALVGSDAGLYVPLTKRARQGGAVYGVDVSEAGISRRKLEGSGMMFEEEGDKSTCYQYVQIRYFKHRLIRCRNTFEQTDRRLPTSRLNTPQLPLRGKHAD